MRGAVSAPGGMSAVLVAESVTRVLPGPVPATLLAGIDLTISDGDFLAVTGPSGSGKSSLLYLLGLLDAPTRGRVWLDGEDTSALNDDALAGRRLGKLGFVFQFHFLLPEFSVRDNVMLPMRRLGRIDERAARVRAAMLLDGLGIGDKADKTPGQLSGGERQRVAIARALANDPRVILADEPTGNLDRANGRLVFEIFRKLASQQGRAVVVVTHDAELAALCSRRIHLVDGRMAAPGPGH
jgi:lipoprotein-releasing system ATP-binding protein